MTTRFFSLILLLFCSVGHAQNLVPNSSFEEFENGCPENFNEMPVSWTRWKESANSFSTCVDPQNFSDSLGWVPWNGWGTQLADSGESYVGLYAFSPSPSPVTENDYREYIGCELIQPLEVGETYYVSFKTSMGFGNYYFPVWACNRLGAYFTTQGYHYQNNPLEIPNYAHVYEENIISDTTNWVTIEGSFIADQAYTHMGLGVFFDFNLLDTMSLMSVSSLGAYYYLDDVCVSRFEDCLTSTDIDNRDNPHFIVFPNPASVRVMISGSEPILEIRLLSLDGKELKSEIVSVTNTKELSLSDLSNGTYLIEIFTTLGYKREKLVVLR
jgi:hypothetical protein